MTVFGTHDCNLLYQEECKKSGVVLRHLGLLDRDCNYPLSQLYGHLTISLRIQPIACIACLFLLPHAPGGSGWAGGFFVGGFFVGVKYKSTPIEDIQRGFEHIYNIPLQVENVGHTLTSLESDLYIARGATNTNFVGPRMACKTSFPDTPGKFKFQYPEPHVPHARHTFTSLVPAEAKRAIYYRVTRQDLHSNVRSVVAIFERKGYPTWRPLLRERLHRWGVSLEDCYEDQSVVVVSLPELLHSRREGKRYRKRDT